MEKQLTCPLCKGSFPVFANPAPTTDVIIHGPDGRVVLRARRNEPLGWALPGGFVDEGEYVEDAARREMQEETGLDVVLEGLLGVYSRPDRDPRRHTQTTVFVGVAADPAALKAGDDAGDAVWADPACPPSPLCFDHARMLADYLEYRAGRRALASLSTDWLATPQGRTGGRKA